MRNAWWFIVAAVVMTSARPLGAQESSRIDAVVETLASGVVPTALDRVERDLETGRGAAASYPGRGAALRAITELGFPLRGYGAALRATTDDPTIQLLVMEAAQDSAGVRDAILLLDAARARVAVRNLPPPLTLAEAELFLGDSTAALSRLLAFEASWTQMERGVAWGVVRNSWMLGRTWLLLGNLAKRMGRTREASAAFERAAAEGQSINESVLAPATAVAMGSVPSDGRVRYDATIWMTPAIGPDQGTRPLARLSLVANEQASQGPGGVRIAQTFDSIALDMPALDRLGNEGLALRRRIQSSAGRLTAITTLDARGRVADRSVQEDGLPGEFSALIAGPAGFGPLDAAIPMPDCTVRPGDSWHDTLAVAIPGSAGPAVRVPVTFRLSRIVETDTRRLAFITIAGSGMEDSTAVSISGEIVRDLASGVSLRLAASLRARVAAGTAERMPVRVLLTALRDGDATAGLLAAR